MKLLVITTRSPYPLHEGRALRSYNLLKQAAKHHDVYLLTFVHTPEEVEGIAHLRSLCARVEAVPLYLGRQKWWVIYDALREAFGAAPIKAVKYRSRAMRAKVRALLSGVPIDLVVLDMLPSGEYLDLCAHKPVILDEHNVESALWLQGAVNASNPLVRLYLSYQHRKLRAYETRICRGVDQVVAVSDLDARQLEELAGISGVVTIPNGVDTAYFADSGAPARANSLVYVGGLTWAPNQDAIRYFCSEILPRLAAEVPEVSLTVIGKVPSGGDFRDIVDNPRVRMTGLVDDVRALIAAASAYVVPLRVGGGTRLKILDALAMAKPLVSTSVGCEGLDVIHGQHLLIADTPEAFAQQVLCVLREPDLARRLGLAGRRLVEQRYDWDVIARGLNSVYERCARLEK
ncbi:MAG: glycosyltransferase family 4 protein [Gammaproteobacteria bacterium]